MKVSVAINNYNYGQFVSRAIESALSQTYNDVEVIVVDDGSNDNSRQIIANFGKRVTAVHKTNGGQGSALNAAFRRVTGEVVFFLDADDFLYPETCATIVAAWHTEYSKIQFPLKCVDSEGRELGYNVPRQPLDSGEVRQKLLKVGYQVCAYMSGNAWNARVLEKILPMPEEEFRVSADDYLNTLAPFYGPVASIDETLGAYRLHADSNWSAKLQDKTRFYSMTRAKLLGMMRRISLTRGEAEKRNLPVTEVLPLYDFSHTRLRLISLRGERAHHPFPSDTYLKLLIMGFKAPIRDPYLSFARKTKAIVSFLVFALCSRASICRLYFKLLK